MSNIVYTFTPYKQLKTNKMKNPIKKQKQVNGELIGTDKLGNVFKLNGNGVWTQINLKELFKLV